MLSCFWLPGVKVVLFTLAIDRFFYRHNGPDKYESCNIMILRETHRLLNEEK